MRFEVHQAVRLRLQEVCYPLGRGLTAVPALDLQALHSAGVRGKEQAFEDLDTLPCPTHIQKAAPGYDVAVSPSLSGDVILAWPCL